MPCSDRYSMHICETELENILWVEFWTFSAGGDQQPATADSGSCPGRCECRQLSSPMCHSAMWGWGSLCARNGLLHVWMRTRLSWHTVSATCCPHHATGHTNPQVCWWQLSPLQWSWHNAKASSKLLCFILLYFTCIVPNEWITIKYTFRKAWKELTAVPYVSFHSMEIFKTVVLFYIQHSIWWAKQFHIMYCILSCMEKSVPSITLKGFSKSFS